MTAFVKLSGALLVRKDAPGTSSGPQTLAKLVSLPSAAPAPLAAPVNGASARLSRTLDALKLPAFRREYDKVARQCAAEGLDHSSFLLRLAELELVERERRAVERRIKEARFPAVKGLDSF